MPEFVVTIRHARHRGRLRSTALRLAAHAVDGALFDAAVAALYGPGWTFRQNPMLRAGVGAARPPGAAPEARPARWPSVAVTVAAAPPDGRPLEVRRRDLAAARGAIAAARAALARVDAPNLVKPEGDTVDDYLGRLELALAATEAEADARPIGVGDEVTVHVGSHAQRARLDAVARTRVRVVLPNGRAETYDRRHGHRGGRDPLTRLDAADLARINRTFPAVPAATRGAP